MEEFQYSILTLGTMLDLSGNLHAPASLSPEKDPRISLVYETGWVPEVVWELWGR
jgi:hypothetical protein